MKKFGFLNFAPGFYFDADEGGGGGESEESEGDNSQEKETRTGGGELTQEQVNELLGKTRKEASDRAVKKVLEELGVDKLDAVKQILKTHKDREDAEKSELEKLQAANDELAKKHAAAIEANRKLLLRQEFYARISSQNLVFANDQARKDAFDLAEMEGVEVSEEGSVSGMENVVKNLLKSRPHLFGKKEQETPDIDAARRGSGKSEGDLSKERAAQVRKKFRL